MYRNLLYVATVALVATVLYFTAQNAKELSDREFATTTLKGLSRYGQISGVPLTDQDGNAFSLSALRGNILIAHLFFTRCHGPCPLMLERMRMLHRQVPEKVHFVSITVDPEHDTPAILKSHAKKYTSDHRRWHFLWGEKLAIRALAQKQFKLAHDDQPTLHSTRFVLIDQQGYIRGYYNSHDVEDIEQLTQDIEILAKTQSDQTLPSG